ncbi:kinesin-associated protein 3-like isoform X2 [Gordionus sp. m RMFG-2023]|uniref:kinesin-associated protein 3-like isoform X2 n=1 Tax=Gordionus sp. m RMFG-2023 TaxID=3053472 RepID=UPI0031FDED89
MCIIVEHETLLKIIIKILNNQNTTDYDVTLYSTSLFVTVAKFLCFTEKLFSLKIIEIFLKIFYSITKSYSHVNQNELLPKILDIKDKEKTILQNCLQLFIYYTDDHNSCKHYIDLLCKLELIPTLNILSTVKDVIENQIGPLLIHLLFNMSIYKEVIIKYGEHDLVKNLGNFLISGHLIHTDESFHNNMLSLMLNMSFDCKLRIAMLKSGYIDKINNIFKNEKLNKIVKILYNFSLEQNCITRFNGSIIINRLINALVNPRKSTTRKHKLAFEKILPALLINVTTNQTNCFDILSPQNKAAVLCLLDYAIQNRNALLIKFFGNLSMHQSLRLNFQDHLKPLIISVVAADVESFNNTYQNEVIALINALLEDLNCFNSLTRAIDKDVSLLNNLVTFIIAILENDRSKNDDFLLLNTVVLLNVLISKDFSFATLFVQQRILNILSDLMKSKQEDDEFVCQLVYAFYRMMHYDYIQKEIINHEKIKHTNYTKARLLF